jgi:putative transposase
MNRSKNNLRHTTWECKYHVVFIPKYRKKNFYGWLRIELGPIIRDQEKEDRRLDQLKMLE